DTFESEAQYYRPGLPARVSLPGQGKMLPARVSPVLPQFDAATRALRIRLEVENPGNVLRPDMIVDVELPITLPAGISVPADAIVNSGLRKRVFIDRGNGSFEPREIETGWHWGDRVQVVKGLTPGERIVVSGTFLVDSESRLKAAAAGVYGEAGVDPVCGMQVDQAKAKAASHTREHAGKTHYFCSDQCVRDFDKNPAQYLKKELLPSDYEEKSDKHRKVAAATEGVKDPTCGMTVDPKQAQAKGRVSHVGQQTFYFCSDHCKKEFDQNPDKYLAKAAGRVAAGGGTNATGR
ncbi:MAG: YHS domain-containing protein, partial [Acidobacteriia bacterium]|nr:YHS domain-containing protein [Terriglobia bacterium]